MILELTNGVRIENVKYLRSMPDFAMGRCRFFAFVEDKNSEIGKVEIPAKDMSSFSVKEDGETRFDLFDTRCYTVKADNIPHAM